MPPRQLDRLPAPSLCQRVGPRARDQRPVRQPGELEVGPPDPAGQGHALLQVPVGVFRPRGTLIYLAFEPTSHNFRQWSGNDAFWRYLITHAAVDNGVGSALVRPYLRWGGRAPRLAMADFSTHPKPTLDWFWALVAIYGVGLSGALFVFGRRGMVGWGLLAVVGLTVAAGAVAFVVARQRAKPDAAMTRVTVVRWL